MVTRTCFATAALCTLLAYASTAQAEEKPPPPSPQPPAPSVHHTPISSAPQNDDLLVSAGFEHPELITRAYVVYRHEGRVEEREFRRSGGSGGAPYAVVIPKEHTRGAQLGYAIEADALSGGRTALFASRERMQDVTLLKDDDDLAETAFLQRIENRRSVVGAQAELVRFGSTTATVGDGGANGPKRTEEVADQYYRFEGSYTYRLGKVVSEFGIRFGIVRGRSIVPGEADPGKFDVGLNYGSPRVRFRATDFLHFDAEFLTSITEVGYSVGGGGAVLLGDPLSMHVAFGMEGVQVFGVRGYTKVRLPLGTRVALTPSIEITNMPHADKAGVRLLTDLDVRLTAGLALGARLGYQARVFDTGGPTLGLGGSYAF